MTSLAARFDTTPSELTKLNRLATSFIFPGQQLYVPVREVQEQDSDESTPIEDFHDDLPPEEKGKIGKKIVTNEIDIFEEIILITCGVKGNKKCFEDGFHVNCCTFNYIKNYGFHFYNFYKYFKAFYLFLEFINVLLRLSYILLLILQLSCHIQVIGL